MKTKHILAVIWFVSNLSAQQYMLRTFPVGLHSANEVEKIDSSISSHLSALLPAIGELRHICDGQYGRTKGTAFVIKKEGQPYIVSAYHVIEESLKNPTCYFEYKSRNIGVGLAKDLIVSTQSDHLTNDKVTFKFPDVSPEIVSKIISIPFVSGATLKEGLPIVAVGYPSSKIQPLPSVCFGHVLSRFEQNNFSTTACAEPAMSGGPLFSILVDGSLALVGHLPKVSVVENKVLLSYTFDKKPYRSLLPLNIFNEIVLSAQQQLMVDALNKAPTEHGGQTDKRELIISDDFSSLATELSEIFDDVKKQTQEDPKLAMNDLLERVSKAYKKYPLLEADAPLLPPDQYDQGNLDAKIFLKQLDSSIEGVKLFQSQLKAKQKAFENADITENFANKLVKLGVFDNDVAYRTYVFPLILIGQGF